MIIESEANKRRRKAKNVFRQFVVWYLLIRLWNLRVTSCHPFGACIYVAQLKLIPYILTWRDPTFMFYHAFLNFRIYCFTGFMYIPRQGRILRLSLLGLAFYAGTLASITHFNECLWRLQYTPKNSVGLIPFRSGRSGVPEAG